LDLSAPRVHLPVAQVFRPGQGERIALDLNVLRSEVEGRATYQRVVLPGDPAPHAGVQHLEVIAELVGPGAEYNA
jgi:hypothetical protein